MKRRPPDSTNLFETVDFVFTFASDHLFAVESHQPETHTPTFSLHLTLFFLGFLCSMQYEGLLWSLCVRCLHPRTLSTFSFVYYKNYFSPIAKPQAAYAVCRGLRFRVLIARHGVFFFKLFFIFLCHLHGWQSWVILKGASTTTLFFFYSPPRQHSTAIQ